MQTCRVENKGSELAVNGASEYTGVEISTRAGDGDFEVS